MGKIQRWILLISVLLISLAVSAFGVKLLCEGAIRSPKENFDIGMLFLFGGMTVVPFVLMVVGNRFIKSENTYLRQNIRPASALHPRRQKKLLERMHSMRASAEFHRTHPSRSLLYCLLGLAAGFVIGGLGVFEKIMPSDDPTAYNSPTSFMIIGALFGVLSVWAFVRCVQKIRRNEWESSHDVFIANIDAKILDLEKALANPASTNNTSG